MSKRRKNAGSSKNVDFRIRCEELEDEKLMFKARILELETSNREFEQEIRQLKHECKCPKDIAGDFRRVPILAIKNILEFLSSDDLKKMRFLSSWFFATITDEFKSVFRTFHIKVDYRYSGAEFKLEVPTEILSVAMERPFGPEIKLVFDFESFQIKHESCIRETLLKYKNNISGIKIPLFHHRYHDLLEENIFLNNLKRIDIHSEDCGNEDCEKEHLELAIESCNSLIALYANKLEHLGIHGMDGWKEDENEINISEIASLPNLTSLSLSGFVCTGSLYVINKVNFENITNLKLLEFETPGDFDIEDFDFRNLSDLSLDYVDEELSVALLKNNSRSLTKLQITFNNVYNEYSGDYDHEYSDIKFSKLKNLEIGMNETVALNLIENSRNSLEEIHICDNLRTNLLQHVGKFKLPYVKKINFKINLEYLLSSNLVFSLIYAANENTIILLNNERICKALLNHLRKKTRSVIRIQDL